MTKSIRQNKELAESVADIFQLNSSLKKESEVFAYAYQTMASDIKKGCPISWLNIELVQLEEDLIMEENTFAETRTISINDANFQTVLDHYKESLQVESIPFAYLTRLVLIYTRTKLRDAQAELKKEAKEKSDLAKVAAYIHILQDDSDISQRKREAIEEILRNPFI